MLNLQLNKNDKIAFFDSGIGGLTVLKEMISLLPFEEYIYFADICNTPYGIKPPNLVSEYVENAVSFLNSKNIKMLVVACNTATMTSINHLRDRYKFLIIGTEPAIKVPFDKKLKGKVLLLATSLTLKSKRLNSLISTICVDKNKIVKMPADALVTFAENFNFQSIEVDLYIKNLFNNININEFSAIVLGCTHFTYFKNSFKKIVNNFFIDIIDGNYPIALNACNLLKNNNLLSDRKIRDRITFYGTNGIKLKDCYEQKIKESLIYLNSSIA